MLSSNDGGVFVTEGNNSFATSWTPLNNGFVTSQFYSVGLDEFGSRGDVIGGLQDNGTLIASKPVAQSSWNRVLSGDGGYSAITKNEFHPEKIKQSIELLLNGPLPYEFRTTCVKPFVDQTRIEKIGELIRGADHLFLQKFDHTHVSCHDYAGNRDAGFDDAGMADLRQRVQPYVVDCRIR